MPRFRASFTNPSEYTDGKHRFEHWYRDNSVYFITARCRDRFPALKSDKAKSIFWERFTHYAGLAAFEPWVVSVLDNHYHILGYLPIGEQFPEMMRRLHGSVAKLVNDLLPARLTPFWRDDHNHPYFDGCIRDEIQCRRAYRYVMLQSVRHSIVSDWRTCPHTRIHVSLDDALRLARERRAYMEGVAYPRYDRIRPDTKPVT